MSKPSILLVDDDPGQLALFRLMLRHSCYDVRTVSSGTEALQVLHDAPPTVVILDVAMPAPDGPAVLRAIRAAEDVHTLKVILFTVWMERIDPSDAALADKVLRKPTTGSELQAEVRNLLERDSKVQ
jgi:two-component system KDP operon response regulator KdpE